MSKQDQLKQACQHIMNAIIQNASSSSKKMIAQDEQISITNPQYIMIDLDQQSLSYGLFASNPDSKTHWIGMMLDRLDWPHLSFPVLQTQSTLPQQFIDCLDEPDQQPYQQTRPPEAVTTVDNIKLRRIVLYSKTPKFSLLFITLQHINQHLHMMTLKNFHGRILELSFHSPNQPKYQTIIHCLLLFQSPFVILFDIIDINTSHKNPTLKQQLTTLSKRVALAYFTIKFNEPWTNSLTKKIFRSDLECNTLFSHENYNKNPSLKISQTEKNKIQQSLIDYHQSLAQEEAQLLSTVYFQPKKLLKGILRINYRRKIKESEHQRDQIKFEDFIKSQFQLFRAFQMQQTRQSSKQKHEKQPLKTFANCYCCQLQSNSDTPASSVCHTCSNDGKKNSFFCDKCFDAYHIQRGLLFDQGDRKVSSFDRSKQREGSSLGLNAHEKEIQKARLVQQHQKSEKIKKRRQTELIEEKQPQLTEDQRKDVMKLQKNSMKIVELTRGLKNVNLLYQPKHPEPTSQKQYQAQLQNQINFERFMNKVIVNEIQAFQNQAFIAISTFKKSQNQIKSQKQSQSKIGSKSNEQNESQQEQQMDIQESDLMDQESSEN